MSQHQNFDTILTKIYVGGLPWATRKKGLISFFQRFGEIIHANVVFDRAIDRSQGYGFVTFKNAESATRACMDLNPTIDGGIANCKLASNGANVKHNQSKTNLISLRHDDLCYRALQLPSNFHQPLTTYARPPHWDQFYPQHPQQCYNYLQYYNYPPQYLQYNPQYEPVSSYQHYPMVNTNPWYYWPHQSTNAVTENRAPRRLWQR